MKSFTDLEQSKKLAKILPLESADMIYTPIMDIDSMSNSEFLDIPECYPFNEFKDSSIKPLPCWSLNSLIYILPDTITDDVGTIFGLNIKKNFIEYYNPSMGALYATYHSIIAEDLVDACYEMILKLHELKML